MDNEHAGIGHNKPPAPNAPSLPRPDEIKNWQSDKYQDKLDELKDLTARYDSLPKVCENEEQAGLLSDWLKQEKTLRGELDKIRLAEKKPWDAWSDGIHNFFKKRIEDLQKLGNVKRAPYEKYLEMKADAEKRERDRIAAEEAAAAKKKLDDAIAAEAAAKAAQKAAEEEAERVRKKAEEDEIARAAAIKKIEEEAAAAAQKLIDDAAAEAAAAAAREQKLKDELAASKLAERIAGDRTDAEEENRQYDLRKAAEDRKAAEEKLKAAPAQVEQIQKDARLQVWEVKAEGRAAEASDNAVVKQKTEEAKAAGQAVGSAMDAAIRSDRHAAKAYRHTLAGSADLSRTRGEGSVGSLHEYLVAEMVDRDLLLKSIHKIWPFFRNEDIDHALQRWAEANESNRTIPGAHIRIETKAHVK